MEKGKAKRSKREDDGTEGEDRLSNLPEEVLCRILSLLSTKWAVRTCVLSSKWKNLWTTVPVLVLKMGCHDDEFPRLFRFKKFVRHVLNKRDNNANVDTLCFRVMGCVDKLFNGWPIEYAASRNVNHLIIDFCQDILPIPPALLGCRTLKTLDLKNCELPESFSFITLTSLHLTTCRFGFDSNCFDVCASFPNLGELWLKRCDFSRFKSVKISGSKILSLVLYRDHLSESYSSKKCEMQISVPNVTSFSCTWDPKYFSVVHLPSTQHLCIRLFERFSWRFFNDRDLAKQVKENKDAFLEFFQGRPTVEFTTTTLGYVCCRF